MKSHPHALGIFNTFKKEYPKLERELAAKDAAIERLRAAGKAVIDECVDHDVDSELKSVEVFCAPSHQTIHELRQALTDTQTLTK